MKTKNNTPMKTDQAAPDIPDSLTETPCHLKKIPLWLVLLDNIPTLVLFILGARIINLLTLSGALFYLAYSLFSVVFFWARICPFCHHYNTLACPCGYGIISAKLFRKRNDKSFKKVFRQNIGIVFPNWFVPVIVSVYLFLTHYTVVLLFLTISFSVVGFILIPVISKLVGCKNCEIREDCPWMNVKR
jgi:hypothetical protein